MKIINFRCEKGFETRATIITAGTFITFYVEMMYKWQLSTISSTAQMQMKSNQGQGCTCKPIFLFIASHFKFKRRGLLNRI